MKLGILGGGPAGMFAALEASKRGLQVSIIDNNSILGRKLSVTGGGRGNLTNLCIRPEVYYSQDLTQKSNFEEILSKYNADFLIKYLYHLGIPTYHTDDGWVYPVSNSAKNLSFYLSKILREYKVTHIPETFIENIRIKPQNISLYDFNDREYQFDRVIIATGGNAYPQVGASSKILQTLNKLGYQTKPVHPALAPLKTTKNLTSNLKGLRFNAQLTLHSGSSITKKEYGNIIFTEWGLNGPGVMNLSHYYYLIPKKLTLSINPLINFKNEIADTVQNHHNQNLKFAVLLLSYLPEGLIAQYQKNRNILLNKSLKEIQQYPIEDLIQAFDLKEDVIGTRDFKFSQLSTGGITIDQINLLTMKSNIHRNLAFAGEILDIVGPCGGYNLHWAFISGLIAGKHI
jgi:predicted Rossmann fold flavoprotein